MRGALGWCWMLVQIPFLYLAVYAVMVWKGLVFVFGFLIPRALQELTAFRYETSEDPRDFGGTWVIGWGWPILFLLGLMVWARACAETLR